MAERSKTPLIIGLAVVLVVFIAGVAMFTGQDRGSAPMATPAVGESAGGAAPGAGPGKGSSLAGSPVFTLVSKDPAATVTFKLPGASAGEFRPATVSTMGIPMNLQVLVIGPAAKADLSMTGVSRTWSAVVTNTRSEQYFLLKTKKVMPEAVKLADGTTVRVSYGGSFMAPALTHQDGLGGNLANKGSKAFQVMLTNDQGELYVVLMGPVERESDLEAIAREIAQSMTIKLGK